jgi:peptidyl-prolyl cis-trans isomerase D
MLDSIRKRKENFFYSFLILITAAVMLFFGVAPSGDGAKNAGPVAWVNGDAISRQEFGQAVQNKYYEIAQMMGGNVPDEKLLKAFNLEGRALDDLIRSKLIAQEASRLGVSISDRELSEYIRTLPALQTKDGKFDYEAYKKIPNIGEKEKEIRENLRRQKLQEFVLDRIRLSPHEVKQGFWLKNTKVDLEYAKLDFNALAPNKEYSDKEVQAFLATNEAEVKQHYDSHTADYTDKASAKLKAIRVGVPFQASEAQKTESRKKIDAIAKEVTKDNFEAVAKNKSDDEFAKKGGDRGWVTRGTLEQPLEAALEALPLHTVSPVVETPYGYYLLLATEKKDAVVKSYDTVKKSVATKLMNEKYKKTWAEEKRKKLELLLAEGKPIDSELKAMKVQTKKTGVFSLGQGYLPNIGQSDAILDSVFELSKQSPVAKKLFYQQDAYYYVKLASLELPKEEEFSKEKEGVEKNIEASLQNEIFRQWVEGLEKTASIKKEIGQQQVQPEGPETETN